MNACIRAVVRTAVYRNVKVVGVLRGYSGMLKSDFMPMEASAVSNIIQRGGTIIHTSRCNEFLHPEGRRKAADALRAAGIEGLVAIGGDGTNRGAHALWEEQGIPIVSVPGTIDNDLYGTDFTIGYDTAVNTALDAIDKIRDTANSHDRLFFVEVMGRHAGFIALDVAVAGGAEDVCIPETNESAKEIVDVIAYGRTRGKNSMIIVVAEGDQSGGAQKLATDVSALTGLDFRVSILGHIQRGGSPTARDRVLASRLGAAAVEALLAGESDTMVGEVNGATTLTPLQATWEQKKPVDMGLRELIAALAT